MDSPPSPLLSAILWKELTGMETGLSLTPCAVAGTMESIKRRSSRRELWQNPQDNH